MSTFIVRYFSSGSEVAVTAASKEEAMEKVRAAVSDGRLKLYADTVIAKDLAEIATLEP